MTGTNYCSLRERKKHSQLAQPFSIDYLFGHVDLKNHEKRTTVHVHTNPKPKHGNDARSFGEQELLNARYLSEKGKAKTYYEID